MNNFLKILFFSLLLAGIPPNFTQPLLAAEPVESVMQQNYTTIKGEWQRIDGHYLIKVSNVQADGKALVEYFNPQPIHVESAEISTWKGLIKLYVKLQDKNYAGSTYTLYYYAEKDALAGFYYQAPTDKTYQVIFMRNSN